MTTISDQIHHISAVNAVVLVPAYNASATIAETLTALQANPYLDRIMAVIILDDASEDGTVAVAKSSWQSPVPLEIWSNKSNAGQWPTTNAGLARLPVEVEWAFILHADDIVKPNWITLYWNELIGCPDNVATICSSWDTWYPESGKIVPGEEFPGRPTVLVQGTRAAVLDTIERGCWWHISGCAMRILAFRKIGGFEPTMQTGDWDWLLRCLAKGFSVLYLPRSTMRYRQHAHSISSNSLRRGQDIQERLRILDAYRDRGYLSPVDYRRKVRNVMYQLVYRTMVRAVRFDLIGVIDHTRLVAKTLVKCL